MPTVIALDVSLSMRRPVTGFGGNDASQGEQLTRHNLAVQGINLLLNYLQINSKLEFVSLVKYFTDLLKISRKINGTAKYFETILLRKWFQIIY